MVHVLSLPPADLPATNVSSRGYGRYRSAWDDGPRVLRGLALGAVMSLAGWIGLGLLIRILLT